MADCGWLGNQCGNAGDPTAHRGTIDLLAEPESDEPLIFDVQHRSPLPRKSQ
jgi:hypothetical protein